MKVAIASVFAFDANVSLINELKNQYDVYYIMEALYQIHNYIDKDQLTSTINKGTEVEQLKRFKNLIPLEKTYVVKGVRNSQIFRKLSNSLKVHKLVKDINPEVLVIDNCVLTYVVSAILYRKKALLIVHDPFMHSGETTLIDRIMRSFFFKIIRKKVLLNVNQKEKFIKTYNHVPEDIGATFLSIYEFLTHFGSINKKENEKFNVLFFGRISPYKGIKYLLQAFVKIGESREMSNFTLTIAGGGEFDFDIKEFQNYPNINIKNRYIGTDELADLISVSSVVVCPYTDATQSGVVMSSFAFKKPVIATNVGGLPEMIEDNVTGIIVEPKNVEQLTKAIVRLYDNPKLLTLMSSNIEQVYFKGEKSWKKSADLLSKNFF